MSINKDEFVSFLEDFLLEEEAKELEVKITGEEEQDAPMINSMQKANYFLKLVKAIDEDIAAIDELCNEEIKMGQNNMYGDRYAANGLVACYKLWIWPLGNRIFYFRNWIYHRGTSG